MASTSFKTEAGHVPSAAAAAAAAAASNSTTTTSVVTSSGVTFLTRSNSNSNSNPKADNPNSSEGPTTRFATSSSSTGSNNNTNTNTSSRKDRSNSLRNKQNKSGSDPTSTKPPSGSLPNNRTADYSSATTETNSVLHNHRQNHNSSKLPAFRFADLQKDALVRPTLLQHHIPPSPVSPDPSATNPARRISASSESVEADRIQTEAAPQRQQPAAPQRDLHDVPSPHQNNRPSQRSRHIPASPPEHRKPEKSSPPLTSHAEARPHLSPSRVRASTVQASSPANPLTPASSSKRPSSFPDSPTAVAKQPDAIAAGQAQQRRAQPAPSSPETNGTPSGHGATLTKPRRVASDSATKDWAQGQRELLLPKTVDATKPDDKRRVSRPPVSFRPPHITSAASPRAVIPPIRGFRSSGSRKSLVLDMNSRRMSYDGSSDGSSDPNHRDRTLRALEGRTDDDYSRITPPDSAEATPDDSTADIFMRIAREDSTPRSPRDNGAGDGHSAITRLTRSSQRRPFSAAVPSHEVSSPPQIARRLSDQRETSRTRRPANDESAQQMTRELNYRGIVREQQKPSLNSNNNDELDRTQSSRAAPLKPSPITPRTLTFHNSQSEVGSWNSRRRTSVTESNGGLLSRGSHLRNAAPAYGQGRTYNSSPLAPRGADVLSHHPGESHVVEGTESSASTAAPSMIWDELDEMKSRIHRLELTSKPAATSAAAMSRISDDRPATAVTNATSMSASPKRGAGNNNNNNNNNNTMQVETGSATSSQREQQPVILSALSKTKDVVSPDVYTAIESAAHDALSLMSMMGAPGQPGPISSGASTIGGAGSVTDRQLRRKAESICRSLTELCIALTEEAPDQTTQITVTTPREQEAAVSPTASRFNNISSQRRPSALTDQTLARLNPAGRVQSSLEQRRNTLLTSTPLASPRYAALPGTPADAVGRKSSLLVSRRRAGTEEPEEQAGRKSSLLLRTRRAGTEEAEEGRKTSLLLRARRGTDEEEAEESRFRAPSRAATEVNGLRPIRRDYAAQPASQQDPSSAVSSALPRRRLVPSSLTSRLVAPSSPAVPTPTTGRRFLDRSTPERDTSSVADKLAEDRGQRQFSLSQTAMLNRTSSLSRRRDSHIPSLSSPSTTQQQAGVYR